MSATRSLTLITALRDRARSFGFEQIGIASAEGQRDHLNRLNEFLRKGYHGEMAWLAADPPRRADPNTLWPQARSVIMLGANYGPSHDPLQSLSAAEAATISVYAQNQDYHDVLKKRLKQLAQWLIAEQGGEAKVFVDTAAVMEKPLAEAAGIGWQGKHTNLVSRDFGSWLFLGAIFTTLDLPANTAHKDQCGSCHACLDICPTKAFPAPYQLDARRCISYLTIEHKGPIPRQFRQAMGNRIYGCDDCLAVCPWNKFAKTTQELAFVPRPDLTAPKLAALAMLDEAAFRRVFRGSPIKRIGRDRFIRNVLIALGNSATRGACDPVIARLDDGSALVRGAAAWALSRLAPEQYKKQQAHRLQSEVDEPTRAEWQPSAL